ncbi:hypothetical protein AVEN_179748-1 [Araneus ventricosus]|uniref:Uncharacterized protein n=1 Tax=Araneus ventricosus TaxID=182803 RepID=A0A4Y2G5Z7_ARAVE|nr:hypothetical protein AVEN_179748-1 [Araneus ventricosus]
MLDGKIRLLRYTGKSKIWILTQLFLEINKFYGCGDSLIRVSEAAYGDFFSMGKLRLSWDQVEPALHRKQISAGFHRRQGKTVYVKRNFLTTRPKEGDGSDAGFAFHLIVVVVFFQHQISHFQYTLLPVEDQSGVTFEIWNK